MSKSFVEIDEIIHAEMMSHPALFTHPNAKKIAIINSKNDKLLDEVLKHTSVTAVCQVSLRADSFQQIRDERVHTEVGDVDTWLTGLAPESIDIFIIDDSEQVISSHTYEHYLTALNQEGILIRRCESQFNPLDLKNNCESMKKAGFHGLQVLNFMQPCLDGGCSSAILGFKQKVLKRIREHDIFKKSFTTRYYNFDVHKAALALPEFLREELNEVAL